MDMNSCSSDPQSMAASTPADGSGKKVRKPYTITKSRENWSDEEHDKFLEALHLFDRDWKKIEDFIGSKTVIQTENYVLLVMRCGSEVLTFGEETYPFRNKCPGHELIRSHAQKYFLKVQKNGAIAHVPPPRPKRKAAHPYPQKEPKYGDNKEGNNNISGIGNSTRTFLNSEIEKQGRQGSVLHGIPDFAEVYSFIGSVFDPDTKDHVRKLKDMDPINFETVSLVKLIFNFMIPENHLRCLIALADHFSSKDNN
ncbi:hypothetical protein HHK36_010869 [Tetracentron sinense]|uniref:SANT domain-containing protein n=1 Tax=Tetracentron sinense TaxID=13715 RepID=A0A834Z850_TETSI|nr:hypothetical protein HHK36_010869 [Tetracentron sinense]